MANYDKIVFVSKSGNCREAMAAAILEAIFEERGITEHPQVLARGLIVHFSEPMNQKAEAVLTAKLADCACYAGKTFMSMPFSPEEITDSSIVLVMETGHFKKLHDLYPQVDTDQIEVLSEFVGDELEIVDPYGGQLANYGLCYENIRRSLDKLVNMLYGTSQD